MDQTLPLYQRLMIRMHIAMCNCCKAVEVQMKWLRQISRTPEDDHFVETDEKSTLSSLAKQRIKDTLKKS